MKKYKSKNKIKKEDKLLAKDTVNNLLEDKRGLEGILTTLDKKDGENKVRLDRHLLGDAINEPYLALKGKNSMSYEGYVDQIVKEARIALKHTNDTLEKLKGFVEWKEKEEGGCYITSIDKEEFNTTGLEMIEDFLKSTEDRIKILTDFTEVYQDMVVNAHKINPTLRLDTDTMKDEDYTLDAMNQDFYDITVMRYKSRGLLEDNLKKLLILRGFLNDNEIFNINRDLIKDMGAVKDKFSTIIKNNKEFSLDESIEMRTLLKSIGDNTERLIEEAKEVESIDDNHIQEIGAEVVSLGKYLKSTGNEEDTLFKSKMNEIIKLHNTIVLEYRSNMELSDDVELSLKESASTSEYELKKFRDLTLELRESIIEKEEKKNGKK